MNLFQVISRNNDVNGNPYRLILLYDCVTGEVIKAYEARSSSPNIANTLRRSKYIELPSFHVSPSEYKSTKEAFKSVLEQVS